MWWKIAIDSSLTDQLTKVQLFIAKMETGYYMSY